MSEKGSETKFHSTLEKIVAAKEGFGGDERNCDEITVALTMHDLDVIQDSLTIAIKVKSLLGI